MCIYVDLLERVQGDPARDDAVSRATRASPSSSSRDYVAYYRAAKARFAARIDPGAPSRRDLPGASRPLPRLPLVDALRRPAPRGRPPLARREHHPLATAGVSWPSGVDTLEELAGTVPTDTAVARLPPRILDRLRRQAALQLGYRRDHQLRYELIPPGRRRTRSRPRSAARAVPARRLLRHRGRPVGRRRGARVPLRLGRDRRRRAPVPARSGLTTGLAGEGDVRAVRRPRAWSGSSATRRCTSTTTAATSRAR